MRNLLIAFAVFCLGASAAPLAITTTSLPNGRVGANYNATLGASGGLKPYTWSVSAGALPDGLSLNAGTGAISGQPTTPGTFGFTAKVTDAAGATDTQALQILVNPAPLTVTTTALPGATLGSPYSATLSASGGTGGYAWSVSAGALPAGLTLDPSGTISGTPTAAGSSNFTAKVTDSSNTTASKTLSISVTAPTLNITTSSLPDATLGAPYSATLTASGGAGGNTWSISAGRLPAGLALDPSGTISGTPTAPGTSNFTAQVKDSANTTAAKPLSITVAAPPLTITTSSLSNGTVGSPYSQTLSASGGAGGNTWSVTAGSLPAGLSLSAAGTISGTPSAAGASNFTVQVKDSANTTATKALTLTIDPPTLTVTTASLPAGTVGSPYSQTLSASGGSGGNAWSVTAGSLPAGLTLTAAGAITGTPTGAGTSNFTVQVKDAANATATKALSITINAPTLTVTTTSLPSATPASQYSASLTANGGTGAYSWTLVSGALPLGLSLASDGTITGIALLPGTSNFTVQVRDAAGATATKALSITVTASPVTITTQSLPAGEQGVPYSQTLAASGGSGGYRWTVTDGALPAGLTLDATGRISGTPTGSGSAFTVQAADTTGATATKSFSISIAAGPSFSTAATLPSGALGASYSATMAVAGGQPPFTFALASGQLPPGLSLNTSTGEISGKPSQSGTFTFSLQARDAAGAQTQSTFTITIAAGLTITTAPVLPVAAVALNYQVTLAAAGGTAPYSWAATAGSLPAGLTFHANGTIDGTPTTAGAFTFTATVTDATGARATRDFTLTVASGLTITTAPQLPPAVPGAPYSTPLTASGGRPPYTWSIASGSVPAGITLNVGTGDLAGTTAALGTYNFTANVTDAAGLTAQKAFTLTVAPGLTFATPAALPDAVTGTPYSFTLKAAGGQTPYSFRVTAGALPDGLTLNGASGAISGTPTAAGTFNFTVEVSDAGNLKGTQVHTIVSRLPGVPSLSVSGIAATVAPAQQPAISVNLATTYPVAITGRLNLTFVPASGMPDDPAIQFSTGGRSVAFTIPPNGTRATFSQPQVAVQTGSVAGTLQFTIDSLQAGGAPATAPGSPVATAQVAPAAAAIRTVAVNRTANGFEVQVIGLSDTRELSAATVLFSGASLGTTQVTVPLTDAAKTWFAGTGSSGYGGQFTLTLPFTINGTVSLDSVAVVLTNSVGTSQQVSAPY